VLALVAKRGHGDGRHTSDAGPFISTQRFFQHQSVLLGQ
jgi:hypothetical protein